jgi:hypothetical protein
VVRAQDKILRLHTPVIHLNSLPSQIREDQEFLSNRELQEIHLIKIIQSIIIEVTTLEYEEQKSHLVANV